MSILSSKAGSGDQDHDGAWRRLVESIRGHRCVPFLGAGACEGQIPLGGEMAVKWGVREAYPLRDMTSLPRVMQYVATVIYGGDATSLKEHFVDRELAQAPMPDFDRPGQIHGLLAGYDLPLYVTTNYDDFMFRALQHKRKEPQQAHSHWYEADTPNSQVSPFSDPSYDPSPKRPLVFHLHGHHSVPKSLVLTEDDYVDYLVRLAGETHKRDALSETGLLPNYVYSSLRTNPLLFIGYSLRDWTFLVLFRALLRGIPESERRKHVSVQVDPREKSPRRARDFLEKYLQAQSIHIFWDSAPEFAEKLKYRMEGSAS